MSRLKLDDVSSPPPKPAKTFLKPFTSVAMARTPAGYVTVSVRFDEYGKPGAIVIGQAQAAPFGQSYVAGEAKKILQAACGAQ